MNSSLSLIHITTKKKLDKILKTGYLVPHESDREKGVYMVIKLNNNLIKQRPILKLFGNFVIEINQNILFNRNDYSIFEAYKENNDELFGGKIVYDAHTDNIKQLPNIIENLTLLNEIKFNNKISLKKYIHNIYQIDTTNNLILI